MELPSALLSKNMLNTNLFLKYSVSYPSLGTYAARRSRVGVLKEISSNVRTSTPGKPGSLSTLTSRWFSSMLIG